MAGKRQRLTQRRKSCGYTQETFAESLRVDRTTVQRWERGEVDPQPHQRPRIAKILGIAPEEFDALLEPDTPKLCALNGRKGEDLALAIRELSQHLVALDNELDGLPIADTAARSFKKVHRRLGEGDYDHKAEHDVQAAAAELAEVAGWALFDAEEQAAARRLNQEALLLARLSGDREIELLILQNMAMQAGWVGRPREELAIARAVIEQGRISPRVEAIFRLREARGLAGTGQEREAVRTFDRARSLLQDGERRDDPPWAWWVTTDELDGQLGSTFQEAGQWKRGIPYLQQAVQQKAGAKVGYRSISAARLLGCYLEEHAWRDAERLAESIVPSIGETSSARTLGLLSSTANRGKSVRTAPSNLRDALHRIDSMMQEDPCEI
ncbi:helix-turn-helix transcriptional regulator [Streptomyces spirodelae]|uniref:Helix-turn-helix transcriptional regulator n=1 Tax=Streptomyces spirodelae TaxID=2812904 RepID=A0ABS3WUM2_9ACTN|nr:helix-turn-helix transcriptional regulator [Streptomyces spirodelae]MBO8186823.1 helix-turn-helix transcriptional regulator [Streptomyces spirodelae]